MHPIDISENYSSSISHLYFSLGHIIYMQEFSLYRNMFAVSKAAFGPGTGPILMDDVNCSGYETSLSQCTFINSTKENCDHDEDAGVICFARISDGNECDVYCANDWLNLSNIDMNSKLLKTSAHSFKHFTSRLLKLAFSLYIN